MNVSCIDDQTFGVIPPDVVFAYDRLGRVLSATNSAAAYFYAYDANGRLTNEVGPYATLARQYDEIGRSIGYDLLDGYAGTLSRVRYEYADGRFAAVVWTNRGESTGYRADYSYLAGSGLLAALTNSSGLTWTRGYETHRDLLTAVENRNGTNLLSRYDYANDALGRRTARQDSFLFPVSSFVENSFDYNERSELISAQMGNNTYAYDFDPIGNRRSASRLEAAAAVTNLYGANALNQYTGILSSVTAPVTPVFDADGNMTTNGAWSYTWDAENRLIGVSNATLAATFQYDHQSRRVRRLGLASGVVSSNLFAYDGWNLVRDRYTTGANGGNRSFVWGLDLSGGMQGAGGIGGLLSMSIGSVGGATYAIAHYGFDGNGNVSDMVGLYNGQAASGQFRYDPFGRPLPATCGIAWRTLNPFRFSTKYLDADTGMYYYGYRWYDPELGRWLSRDPIGEAGGENLHCHAHNDGITKVDAFGLIDANSVSVIIDINNTAVDGSSSSPCVKACADYYNRTRKQRTEQGIALCFRDNQRCGCAWQRSGLPTELVQCTVEHEAKHVSPPYVTSRCNYADRCHNKPNGLYSSSALSDDEIFGANPSLKGVRPVAQRSLQLPVSECPAYRATFSCMANIRGRFARGPHWQQYANKWNKARQYWEQYQCQQMYPTEPPHAHEPEVESYLILK